MARDVRIAIIGDPSSLQRALRTADTGVTRFGARMQAFGTRMRSFGASMSRNLTLPLVGFGVLAYRELSAGERALAQTQAVIESTGGAARRSVDDILELSHSLSELTSIDDEPIQEAANTLLTFRQIAGDTFDEATAATLDLSVAMDRDLRSSAVMVGRALNDPIRGMAALTRVGVQFTDEQRAAIEAMVAFGDTAGAQRLILEELNAEFGGSAEALGETVTGRLNRVKNQMEEMGASILESLMPALEDLTDVLTGVAGAYEDLTPKQQKFAAYAVALLAVAGPLASVIGAVATALGAVAVALGVTVGTVVIAIATIVALGVALYLVITRWNELKTVALNAIANIRANVPGASAVISALGAAIQLVIGYWRLVITVASAAVRAMLAVGKISLGGLLSAIESIAGALGRVVGLAQDLIGILGSAAGAAGSVGDVVADAQAGGRSAFIPKNSSGRTPPGGRNADDFAEAVARAIQRKTLGVVVVG